MQEIDQLFMRRAIELAEKGIGSVSPNPLVGAVIVHQGQIIGEGYHQKYGEAHAEVNAVNSVLDKSILSQATIYVTLEPCSHFGKTPPCADLLIKHQFKRVVIGSPDPFHLVNGTGINKLKAAGIEVYEGVLRKECDFMNRRFLTAQTLKRPYIILKWAETADGFIDAIRTDDTREIRKISGPESHQLVHQWRSEEDAILVGWKTVLNDNPQLNVRLATGKDPIRIILDPHLQAPTNSKVFDQNQSTIVYNKIKEEIRNNLHYKLIENYNFAELFGSLHELKIQSILIEGGLYTLKTLIEQNYWDEIRRFKSHAIFHQGVNAPQFKQSTNETTIIGTDKLEVFYNKRLNG